MVPLAPEISMVLISKNKWENQYRVRICRLPASYRLVLGFDYVGKRTPDQYGPLRNRLIIVNTNYSISIACEIAHCSFISRRNVDR